MSYFGQGRGILRVLTYHNIKREDHLKFLEQLEALKKNWNFVSPNDFELMMKNKALITGRNVLLTFDDGFKSNRVIAEKILKSLDIKSIFFIVPEFINQTNNNQSKKFIAKFILPGLSIDLIDDDMVNMNWGDLHYLLEQGHVVGAHTMNHKRLSELTSVGEMDYEIIESARLLENNLNIKIKHFAYTFGDISSFSLDALRCAVKKFSFIYTGLRGNNANDRTLISIKRDAVSPAESPLLIRFYLEGGFDFIYKKDLHQYKRWMSELFC